MAAVMIPISLVVFLWGVLGMIRPAWAKLPSRTTAFFVWFLFFPVLLIGTALAPTTTEGASTMILVALALIAFAGLGMLSDRSRRTKAKEESVAEAAAQRELEELQERESMLAKRIATTRSAAAVLALCEHDPPGTLRFQKTEEPVWVVPDCTYMKTTKDVTFHGRSAGVSFRVAKGVTVRTGGSRGRREETENLEAVDAGTAVLTNKHIYFQGEDKERFRVRLDKLVSAGAAADGFLFQRDGVRARPEAFASYEARMFAVLLDWLEAPEGGSSGEDGAEVERDEMLDALAAAQANDSEVVSNDS